MNLNVGIIGSKKNGLLPLLEQTGVPYTSLNNMNAAQNVGALIVSGDVDENIYPDLREYLQHGGSLLCSGEFYAKFSGDKGHRQFIKYLIGDSQSPFFKNGLADVEVEANIPQNANYIKTNNGMNSVYAGEYRGGYVVVLPFEIVDIYSSWDSKRKSFYSSQKRLPHENVSLISKGKIFQLFTGALEYLFKSRGLPYIHKWYYPKNFKTIFNFRIDTDNASTHEIQQLYEVIRQADIPATWFVDCESQEKQISLFRNMQGQEIGLHGYEHKIFRTSNEYIEDFKRAKELFFLNGMNSESISVPFGIWNKDVANAVQEMDFLYSSEFSYDYDNLPSYPVLNSEAMTLQIPVHPICIGSLKRQGYSEQSMMDYFSKLIYAKYNERSSLFLYHHPNDNNLSVVKSIFTLVKRLGIPRILMIDYAKWWKRRGAFHLDASFENENILFNYTRSAQDVWLRIVNPNGTESFTPIQDSVRLNNLKWEDVSVQAESPPDLERIRKFNPFITINRIENVIHSLYKK